MFLVNEGYVYKITKVSAMEALQSAIWTELEPLYSVEVMGVIVESIMSHVKFHNVMDSNDVYVRQQNGELMRYKLDSSYGIVSTGDVCNVNQFKPVYDGPEVKEIATVLDYPLEQLIFMQKSNKNAMIMQTGNENYGIVSLDDNVRAIAVEELSKLLSNSSSENVASDIVQKVSSDSIFLAGLRQNNDIVYYALALDGSCKNVRVFAASELYEIIMSHLPNLEPVSKIAKKISIGIHNRILYGYDFGGYELTSPADFDGERAVFKRTENGIDFTLREIERGSRYSKAYVWLSDYIKIKANEIKYAGTENNYKNTHKVEYVGGTYNGFPIYEYLDKGFDDKNMPLMDDIPIIVSDSMGETTEDRFRYWVVNKRAYRNPNERHPVRCPEAHHRDYQTNNFEAYVRVYISDGE